MQITFEFPDTFEQENWVQPPQLGDFAEEVLCEISVLPYASLYHRHCHKCGADVHADIRITYADDAGGDEEDYRYSLVPRETCPRCQANTGEFRDRVVDSFIAMTEAERDRFYSIYQTSPRHHIHPVVEDCEAVRRFCERLPEKARIECIEALGRGNRPAQTKRLRRSA